MLGYGATSIFVNFWQSIIKLQNIARIRDLERGVVGWGLFGIYWPYTAIYRAILGVFRLFVVVYILVENDKNKKKEASHAPKRMTDPQKGSRQAQVSIIFCLLCSTLATEFKLMFRALG